ncbi:MAG: helix-turn-helix domain-containing protein [Pseudonocardia sp.]
MDEGTGGVPAEPSVGERIGRERERGGLSRAVLGHLVGRSAEWVKAVENGRLHTPRLPMLIEIAGALGLDDVATLTGNGGSVPVSVYAGVRHSALSHRSGHRPRAARAAGRPRQRDRPPARPHLPAHPQCGRMCADDSIPASSPRETGVSSTTRPSGCGGGGARR